MRKNFKLFTYIMLVLFFCASCSKPAWKEDKRLRHQLQTRQKTIPIERFLVDEETWQTLNIFDKINPGRFVSDFKRLQNEKLQKGRSKIDAFFSTYVEMHWENAPSYFSYSPSLTGFVMWFLFFFLISLLFRVIGMVQYKRRLINEQSI